MAASEDQNRLNSDRAQDSALEQYGVWVKAGPEDVDENEAEDGAFALTDLGDESLEEGEGDLLGFDQDLGTDELDLEDLAADESTEEEPVASDTADAFGEPDPDEEEDLLTLDDEDFGLHLESAEEPGEPEHAAVTAADEPSELEELDLDDLSDEHGLIEPEPEPAAVSDEGPSGAGAIDIDDELPGDLDDLTLDLETLDVDSFEESAEPEDQAGETDELDVLEPEEETDELDLDALQLDDTETAEIDLSALPGDTDSLDEPPQDLSRPPEDDLPELEIDDGISDDLGFDEMFNDVAAVEDEMVESGSPRHEGAGGDRSAALLESIEHELSSIRTELANLKQELSRLRSAPAATAEPREGPAADDQDAGGFFEDEGDDDETIALTGAELDNIMNTAEFTEQPGRPTDFDDMVSSPDQLDEQPEPAGPAVDDFLGSLDLPGPEGEADTDSPVQEITLEESPRQTDTIDLDIDLDVPEEPATAVEPGADDEPAAFEGSEDEVEALASMDIDAELADIEELDDTSAPPSPPAEVEAEEDSAPLDAEFLDAEYLGVETAEEPFLEEVQDEPFADVSEATAAGTLSDEETPIPENLKGELRSVLNYMDKLLESLPEEKIQEFAASEHFKVYRRLFEELGLEQ